METYLKTLVRTFKKHITRLLSIIFIVLISVGFSSGIGLAADSIGYSLSDYYKEANVADLIIKDSTGSGFTEEDVAACGEILPQGSAISFGSSFDIDYGTEEEHSYVRLYFLDFENWSVNIPRLMEGTMPANGNFALCEAADNKLSQVAVGTDIRIDFKQILKLLAEGGEGSGNQMFLDMIEENERTAPEVEVCGIVTGALTFGCDGEPSYFTDPEMPLPETTGGINGLDTLLSYILYLPASIIPTYSECLPFLPPQILQSSGVDPEASVLPKNADMYCVLQDRELFSDFSADYKNCVEGLKAEVEEDLKGASVITLYDNYSFYALHSYGNKVELIGYVLMAAFLFVTALVVLSTMTRLLEEERAQIACLKTLGYSSFKIIFKYILFAAIATGIGGVGAYFVGTGLSALVYWVFGYSFFMPPATARISVIFFIVTFAVIAVIALFATFMAGRKLTGETPASLLRPKAPKAGKKVIIEKIPFIWNRLSFKRKSTLRNVLRYKSRFFMTVIAVAFSMGLVMGGLTLLDICLLRGAYSLSILIISLVIIVFAGLLTAVVIYTLTNINISERNRELATLKVLGYFDGEVAGYIYREIFIDAAIGIIFGYPVSAVIMYCLFLIMASGTYATFMWAVAPFVVMLFTGAVALFLRRKIVKIDMNESLKATE